MNSLRGQFLIAAPELNDPNFKQTVVLMLGHDDGGAVGIVLTRRSRTTIKEAWEQVCATPCRREDFVHVGGPCPGPLMAIHARKDESNAEVVPGVFLTQTPDKLEQLVDSEEGLVKFFVGYAGWGPQQLEGEIEQGAWLSAPASLEQILADEPPEWEPLVRRAAGASVISVLNIKHVPADPRLN
jgi:putative transcriptional regulator